MTAWITVVGIGEDGLAGLTPAARALVESAELLVGGERHQAMVPETEAERLTWADGLEAALDVIARWRGRRVVVLATGDPMCYGAGANLQRRFRPEELLILPVPGAFSLAAARMRWSLPDVETLTIHGRPLEVLNFHLAPGARLVALSRDGDTPAQVAALLLRRGFGPSRISVLENMGGPRERRLDGIAETWSHPRCADLNTLAIECLPGPAPVLLPRVPGLPEEAFEHDGQITKREVRAATVAALAPLPGQVLWDVGAGSGAVGIEWLRAVPRWRAAAIGRDEATAYAVERNAGRAAAIARNAGALGVPRLNVVQGEAPPALVGLPRPDTVFVGGGVSRPDVLEACWDALAPGGRLVANAATLEGEARLLALHARLGGELIRISIERAEAIGAMMALKPQAPVLQFRGVKR